MIGIVDYGMGNLESVRKAFARLGFETTWIRSPGEIDTCERIVLPGVGAFGQAMENLRRLELIPALHESLRAGRPLLGICLGLQLLFETSHEYGTHEGLGWIAGTVRRLPPTVRVPHVGWNSVCTTPGSRLFAGIPDRSHFYFVQSYFVDPEDASVVTGTTEHGVMFAAAVESGALFGVQFHPEKSQTAGLALLDNFGRLRCS